MADWKLEYTPLTFEEAVQFFREKVALTPAKFNELAQEWKLKAFTIAGIGKLDVLRDILEKLDQALAEGTTLQEFRQKANELLEKRGWDGLTPYRADNIFRTNIQTAYNVGRYRQMSDPDVLPRRPYWLYDAVNDRRTRPTHAALDGKAWRANDHFWDTWYPPNGYRCRCSVRSLSERDVKRLGLTIQEGIPAMVAPPGRPVQPLMPDPGWSFNPGKVSWQPDLAKYPPALQQAYARRQERGF
ncbi:MAG: phage minor head protein [Firmicutes bacterium]|nr:phage minor head protein [Bacillota bacterium]